MIVACWSERREQRWGVRAVYDLLSASSVQEIAEAERGDQCASLAAARAEWFVLIDPQDRSSSSSSDRTVRQTARDETLNHGKNSRSQAVPVPSTPTPKKRFSFPTLFRTGRDNGPRTDQPSRGKRLPTILSRGWNQLQAVTNVLTKFVRPRRSPGADGRPSQ